jgi:hypothetical protein
MSIPKFNAEASLGNYANVYVNRKYKIENSVKIEPAMPPRDPGTGQSCHMGNCETRVVRYPCGSRGPGQPPEMCERNETICDCWCYYYDKDGQQHGPIYAKCKQP